MKHLTLVFFILFLCLQAQGQQWRPIARKGTTDTALYTYSGNRGSTPMLDSILYDAYTFYDYDSRYKKWYPSTRWKKSYNLDGQIATYNFDVHYLPNGWRKHIEDTMYYNAKALKDKHTKHEWRNYGAGGVWYKTREEFLTYNSKDLLSNHLTLIRDTILDSAINAYYTYNTNDLLIIDSQLRYNKGVWEIDSIRNFMYNAQSNLQQLDVYTYNNVGVKQHVYRQYYYYNTQGQLAGDSIQTYYPDVNKRAGQQDVTFTYNAFGQTKQIVRRIHDTAQIGVDRINETNYYYTDFNYVDTFEYIWKDKMGNVTSRVYIKYYYELYWPLEVPNTSQGPVKLEQELTLFPNPATDNLKMIWVKKGLENVEGRIVDITGHVLQTWKDATGYYYYKKLNTSKLSPGNYFVELQTNLGKVHRQFVIVR